MKTLHFSAEIHAPKEKVWDTMLGQDSYREWTSAFNEGSRYEGNWEEGSKMLFLGPDPETGKEGGMLSRVKENRLHEFVSIEHIGMVHDGVEDTTSEAIQKWLPAFENYTFKDVEGGTEVSVSIDTIDEYADMFAEMWPKALAKLKEMCEG